MNTFSRLVILIALLMAACADPNAASTGLTDPSVQQTDEGETTGDTASTGSADAANIEVDPVPGTAQDTPTDSTMEPVPMPVEPDGGTGGDTADSGDPMAPPAFGVSSETDSMSVDPSSYCWNGDDGMGVCADGAPTPPLPAITADSQLVVTFAEGELRVSVDGDAELPVVMENPGIYLVDVSSLIDASTYELGLGFNGEQGDASGYVALTISRS